MGYGVLFGDNLKKNKGFTLVELSIVIVIIGLIVAGVVGGQSLVKQSKIRALISDYNKYNIAVNAFKLEYNGLPGDLSNASAFGLGTSGNGDKWIHHRTTENLYSWGHLSSSGLIQGAYTGASASPPRVNQIGVNIPASSYGSDVAVYFASIRSSNACLSTNSTPMFGTVHNVNIITFAKLRTNNESCARIGFLNVKDAFGIDQKIDDGIADSGIMFSANSDAGNSNGSRCVDRGTLQTGGANYDLDETGDNCRLLFRIGL